MSEVTHQLPPDDAGGIMPCCGRTPFEAPRTDRMTEDPTLVTCTGEVHQALVEKGAEALRGVQESWGESLPASETRMRARAVLDAVLPDVRRQVAEEYDAWLSDAAELHKPVRLHPEYRFKPWCGECSTWITTHHDDGSFTHRVDWPCRTAQALGMVDPLALDTAREAGDRP